jgi:hypothetical protein
VFQQGQEVKAGQGHARDVFALGVFLEQLSEQLSELGMTFAVFFFFLMSLPCLRAQGRPVAQWFSAPVSATGNECAASSAVVQTTDERLEIFRLV